MNISVTVFRFERTYSPPWLTKWGRQRPRLASVTESPHTLPPVRQREAKHVQFGRSKIRICERAPSVSRVRRGNVARKNRAARFLVIASSPATIMSAWLATPWLSFRRFKTEPQLAVWHVACARPATLDAFRSACAPSGGDRCKPGCTAAAVPANATCSRHDFSSHFNYC